MRAHGFVLVASLSACSSARAPATHRVDIRAMQFVPAVLEVQVGDTIVWTNSDVVPHTATSTTTSVAMFDSQRIASHQQWRYRVVAAGEHTYVCTYHPTMRGSLVAR